MVSCVNSGSPASTIGWYEPRTSARTQAMTSTALMLAVPLGLASVACADFFRYLSGTGVSSFSRIRDAALQRNEMFGAQDPFCK